MTRYGFAIDLKRCVACGTCLLACKIENNVPENIQWNRVLTDGGPEHETPAGTFPNLTMDNYTVACQHCENPACTKVCPVGATYKDPETGIVRQDADKCIGCRMCMAACPYSGVRSFNWEEPVHALEFATGGSGAPAHQKHTVEKCTMCYHRTSQGGIPACTELCPGRARHWGDLDDPESEVSKVLSTRSFTQLLTEKGTNPNVYYLV